MSNRVFSFLVVIITFLIVLFPLYSHPFYESHDGEVHVARINGYYNAFLDGHFPPRWAGNLNYRFGAPVFLFYYPLPGYVGSIFHMLGLSLEDSFKLLMTFSIVFSFLSMYLYSLQLFKKEIALAVSIFYILTPYHLLDLYVRGDVAELMVFVFLPFVLYSIEKLRQKSCWFYVALGSLAYGMMILSHNGLSLIFSPIILLYILMRLRKKKILLQGVTILFLGLSLSAYFWHPALSESQYVTAQSFIKDSYKNNFPSILQLIYSSWGFGSDVNKADGLSPQIGPLFVLFIFFAIVFFVKNRLKNRTISFWLVIFFSSVFLSLPFSTLIWSAVPILRLLQFPWRFIAISSFAALILGGYVLDKIDRKITFVLVCIGIITILPTIKVSKYVSHSDDFYEKYVGSTSYHGETTTIWTAGDPSVLPEAPIEVIEGKAEVKNLKKKTQIHEFSINAKSDVRILDNTIFFPGWLVTVDGVLKNIEFQDISYRGLITFRVPQGEHTVKVFFIEPRNRKIADAISLLSLIGIVLIILISKIRMVKK